MVIPQNKLEKLAFAMLQLNSSWQSRLVSRLMHLIGMQIPPIDEQIEQKRTMMLQIQASAAARHILADHPYLLDDSDFEPMFDISLQAAYLEAECTPESIDGQTIRSFLMPMAKSAIQMQTSMNPTRVEMEKWILGVLAIARKKHQSPFKLLATEKGQIEVWRQTFTEDEFVAYFLPRIESALQVFISVIPTFLIGLKQGLQGVACEVTINSEVNEVTAKLRQTDGFNAVRQDVFRWLTKETELVYK